MLIRPSRIGARSGRHQAISIAPPASTASPHPRTTTGGRAQRGADRRGRVGETEAAQHDQRPKAKVAPVSTLKRATWAALIPAAP